MDYTAKLKEHFVKFKQRLETIKEEEELSTGEEYLETDEPFDDGHELIKKEYLLQVSCNNHLETSWTQTAILPFESYNMVPPSLMDDRDSLRKQVCVWFAQEHDLKGSQKELNAKLLSILKYLDWYEDNIFDYDNGSAVELEEFLKSNENDPNLKVILNLPRGESGVTVLHAVSRARTREAIRDRVDQAVDLLLKAGADPNAKNNEGATPLHYAAAIGNDKGVSSLLQAGANPSMCDRQGKTPQQIAVAGGYYNVAWSLLTKKQEKLRQELCNIWFNHTDLFSLNKLKELVKRFLDEHKSNPDLKVVLNIRRTGSKALFLELVDNICYANTGISNVNEAIGVEIRNLFLEAGASYDILHCLVKKEPPSTLWRNLTPAQQKKLDDFLGRISKVECVNKLEKIVDEAIRSGVRLGFNEDFSSQCPFLDDWHSFADYVIKRIGELKGNPKTASDIICKLISNGAVLYNRNSMNIIDELELEFKDFRANVDKTYASHRNNANKFIKAAREATTGRLNDVRIDNTIFYLEYSEDSTINVAMITDEEKNLVPNQKNIQSRKDIIKIGKSEVEIITANDIRHYTDLTDGSDIVLIFYTSLGELEVRLYPDVQNKNLIRVEIRNQEMWEKLKNYKEEIGENCSLGRYSVYDAIEQGYFERPGQPSEKIILPNEQKKGKWCERVSKISQTQDKQHTIL